MERASDLKPMPKRRLPIGIQAFRKIREEGCYYVDKTAYIRRLVDGAKHFFLTRPRRFGKSLFLDTCKELFEGNEPLFEGLDIHEHWDWSARHPVVRLDFSSANTRTLEDVRTEVAAQLSVMEDEADVTPRDDDPSFRFGRLIEALHERSGRRVAVLVDEYEKPILDNLDTPATARAIRDYLFNFYSTTKSSDADIHFSLFTGVHKFPLAGPFSGLNNLIDITLDPRYSAICGYTEGDLDMVFSPEIPGLDRDEIRDWYNGYGWGDEENVYNPFDILLLFDSREFKAHWFDAGIPAFLVDTLTGRGVHSVDLDDMLGTRELLSTFDVDHIATEALLFQTGYLTILRTEPRGGEMFYRLGYPNRAARKRLDRALRRLTDQ